MNAVTDHSVKFAQVLLHEYGHEIFFRFDLRDFDYDIVKLILEEGGYSVHRNVEIPWIVCAYRAEPDLAPSVHAVVPENAYRMAS